MSKRMASATAAILIGLVVSSQSGPVQSQAAARLEFEVASIKPSPPGNTRELGGAGVVLYQPGGRLKTTNAALSDLIVSAYGIQHWQISGGPAWVDPSMMVTADRYNIEAKSAGEASRDELKAMLKSLLADRFKLQVHSETKVGKTYDLVVGKNGPTLEELKIGDYAGSRVRAGGGGRLFVDQMTMAELAIQLKGQLQTPIVDRTGLKGVYKFNLQWTPDVFRLRGEGREAANNEGGIDANGPSLFDAVQEQLGLKLQETRGPIEHLVIDRAERPAED